MLAASIQSKSIRRAVRAGLQPLVRPEPKMLVEWSNENFYISTESGYIQGPWETLPFQVAPMNMMGHPEIEQFNLIKSKRVGYSQMLRAAIGYFAEHKKRHQIIYQPTDGAAEGFMKTHIESMIRDVPVVKALAPWYGRKHRDNTLNAKRFSNGKQLWCLGGTAAKNYREKSADNVYYDELAAFDDDIEKEGSPTFLGDGRLEGSAFPKSIRGSTPGIEPDEDGNGCQITMAGRESECFFRFHLPCPHCDQEQVLKWGGPDSDFGFKWVDDDPKTVAYLCEHCHALIKNQQLLEMELRGVWRCEKTSIYTTDGLHFYQGEGDRVEAPLSATVHIWSAYNPMTTWEKLVRDWQKTRKSRSKLKTFINTVLGETWQEDEGDKVEPNALFMRREHYEAEIPIDSCILTTAVDTQDDRFEIQTKAWVAEEESYAISYRRLYGDLSQPHIWQKLTEELSRRYTTKSGVLIESKIVLIDSGGHYTDDVYSFCRRNPRRLIPTKGHSHPGKPIAVFPRKANSKGVYLTMIGADTAKEVVTDRMKNFAPGAGYLHYPVSDEFDETFFVHLTNERKKAVYKNGRRNIMWDAGGRRNEPFDLEVLNLAGIRLLQQHFGINLDLMKPESSAGKPKGRKKSSFL